jgi:acyl-CoA synthetase (AMP-forming)/AMP-acid ligase II
MQIAPFTSEEIAAARDALLAEGGLYAAAPGEVRGVAHERVFALSSLSLREVLAARAAENAEATFLVFGEERLTVGEVWARAMRFANWLHARGVGPGDRVAIAMRNYPEWVTAYLGGLSCGACVVPLNAWWTAEELVRGLERSGAKLVVADERRATAIEPARERLGFALVGARGGVAQAEAQVEAIVADEALPAAPPPVPIDADSDFALMFTSGSTGEPKGALLTHRSVTSAILSWSFQLEMFKRLRPDFEFVPENPGTLLALPLFHVTASHAVLLLSFLTGRKVVMMYKWDAREAARLVKEEALTNFTCVPTMAAELVKAAAPGQLGTMRDIGTGGAKRPESQLATQREAYPEMAASSGYGLTETNGLGTHITLSDYDLRPSSTGRALEPITKIEAFSEDGGRLARGETGEICILSPATFRGYMDDEAATRAAFHADGWFRTGDLGYVDEEGFVFIVDRLKDLIIRGGENVSCLEVENALLAQDGVDEACAFSVPDEALGERVGAAIWSKEGTLDPAKVREGAARLLASFKVPERIWVSPAPLPRGNTGKTDKRATRRIALENPPALSV